MLKIHRDVTSMGRSVVLLLSLELKTSQFLQLLAKSIGIVFKVKYDIWTNFYFYI